MATSYTRTTTGVTCSGCAKPFTKQGFGRQQFTAHGTSPMPAGLVSAIALKAEERMRLERQHGRAGPKTKASRAAPRTKSTTKSKQRKVG